MYRRPIRLCLLAWVVVISFVFPGLAYAEPGEDVGQSEFESEQPEETPVEFAQRVYGMPAVLPENRQIVGVAQPILVSYSKPVALADRVKVQQSVKIKTNPPQEGIYYWFGDKQLRWRPTQFWAPGTIVDVDAGRVHSHYSIGDAFVTVADDKTHTVTVTLNGKVVKTMPVSMGMDKFPTPNGTYYLQEREPLVVMDSSTFGIPVNDPSGMGYKVNVQYASRMSWNGIYLHAAPWSVASQGKTDVSHGCLNVSTENAKWFMDNSHRGDPVIVRNTKGGILSNGDGLGDWN